MAIAREYFTPFSGQFVQTPAKTGVRMACMRRAPGGALLRVEVVAMSCYGVATVL
jgi:hypothetical protein